MGRLLSGLISRYHAAVFGVDFDFENWEEFKRDSSGIHYTSPTLLKLWPFGFNEIGLITQDRLNYVAGYIQKKMLGGSKVYYSDNGIVPPDQRYSKNLGVEALKRDADRLRSLFLQKRGKPLPRYYAHKLAFNEVTTDDGFQLAALYAKEYELSEREKYPELSDFEYVELMQSKRRQAALDIESRMNLFDVRSTL